VAGMNRIYLLAILALVGCSSSKPGYKPGTDIEKHIMARRDFEIRRQAPLMGIPVADALSVRVKRIHLCPEEKRSQGASYSCGDCTKAGCVHAWFLGSQGNKSVEYLYVTPAIPDGVISHEVHHELCVVWYGIGGHPARSQITRIDNGKPMTLNHPGIVGWRWPALFDWTRPARWTATNPWSDFECGTGEILIDGAGI